MSDYATANDEGADQRRHERYPAWIIARGRGGSAGEPWQALVVDISMGGVGLRTPYGDYHPHFTLEVEWDGARWLLPCETVLHTPAGDRYAVHARFGPLDPSQKYSLQLLLRDLQAQVRREAS